MQHVRATGLKTRKKIYVRNTLQLNHLKVERVKVIGLMKTTSSNFDIDKFFLFAISSYTVFFRL